MERLTINGNEVLFHDNGQEIGTFRVIARAGSSDEHDPADYGCAHFLEHIFFKGTESRTWAQISETGARLGDQNAYTNNERTCYHQSFAVDDFEEAGDLVCDMLFHPVFREEEFERERGVILEECQTYLDDPLWYFLDMMDWRYWGERGHRIVGRKSSVRDMTQDRLMAFRDRNYKQSRMAFAVVGGIERARVVDFFSKIEPGADYLEAPEPYTRDDRDPDMSDFRFHHHGEQAIIAFGGERVPTAADTSAQRAAWGVLMNGLGQGMHSMLFQRIREELGFCYRIRVEADEYRDLTGMFVYSQMDKGNVDEARGEILAVVDRARRGGFGDELLLTAKRNHYFNEANRRQTSDGFAGAVFDEIDLTGEMEPLGKVKEDVFAVTDDDIKAQAERFFPESREPLFFRMTNEEEYKAEEYS